MIEVIKRIEGQHSGKLKGRLPMSGKASRDKGFRTEREFVKLYGGERVPLSGAAGGSFTGDVVDVAYIGRGEIKRREQGFKQLYKWLADNDFVAFRADRAEWLVCLKMDDLHQLTKEMDELKVRNHALEANIPERKG